MRHLYRCGPWLIVSPGDPGGERLVDAIAGQVRDRDVDVQTVLVHELPTESPTHYPVLVPVLPTNIGAESFPELFRLYEDLLAGYRVGRPHGLDALLAGRCVSFKAGVILLACHPGLAGHRAVKRAAERHRVCDVRPAYPDQPAAVDIFGPFEGRRHAATEYQPVQHPAPLDGSLAELRRWGVLSLTDVARLMAGFEQAVDHFENPRYPALYRPVPGVKANRLAIILFDVDVPPPHHWKPWTENGARVARVAIAQLSSIVPTFRRPGSGTRGLQQDLRSIHTHLRTVHYYLQLTPRSAWPSF